MLVIAENYPVSEHVNDPHMPRSLQVNRGRHGRGQCAAHSLVQWRTGMLIAHWALECLIKATPISLKETDSGARPVLEQP